MLALTVIALLMLREDLSDWVHSVALNLQGVRAPKMSLQEPTFFEIFQLTYPSKTQCSKLEQAGGKKITWEIFIFKGWLVKYHPKLYWFWWIFWSNEVSGLAYLLLSLCPSLLGSQPLSTAMGLWQRWNCGAARLRCCLRFGVHKAARTTLWKQVAGNQGSRGGERRDEGRKVVSEFPDALPQTCELKTLGNHLIRDLQHCYTGFL